ncbi:MAG: ATP-binding protein [Anaerolinea sp.]|nr:ATP-binding protein [Anaerolinea sp.]
MNKSLIIIFHGPPASGKTLLSRRLAHDLNLPLFSKDDLKEALFDALPNSAPNWTAQLGAACFQALFRQLETQLRAGVPAMITETAFWAEQSTAHFLDLKSRYRLEFLQFYCIAATDVLYQREQARRAQGERHACHTSAPALSAEEFKALVEGPRYARLPLESKVIDIDTNDLAHVDYMHLMRAAAFAVNR